MTYKTRLFLVLWLAGIAGVLSLLLVDISALIEAMPRAAGELPPELPPPMLLKLASIAQPAVLTTIAVLVGIWLAPKVGLHAPVAEAIAGRTFFWPALRPQIIPGLIAGLLSGVAIVLIWVIAKPYLSAGFVTRAEEFNKLIPAAVRFLYGGFTEEILLRWGVMTFLVWALWRVFQRRLSSPPARGGVDAASAYGVVGGSRLPGPAFFIVAIVASALIFGIGHLPVAYALGGGLTLPMVIYVVTANSIFGIAAGFLYWRLGLEAAMLAHISAHVVLIAAISLAF